MKFPSVTDHGIGVAVTTVVVLGTVGTTTLQGGKFGDLDVLAFVLMAVAGMATGALRRAAPVWATAITIIAVYLYLHLGYPFGPVQLCMVVVMFELARQRPLRISLPACALGAAVAAASVVSRLLKDADSPTVLGLAWTTWIVLPWSLGALVHVVHAARDRARRDLVARVALEERMKIASEVHDVAGHGFAVVAMQAGVALLVFDEQPAQARKSLEAIQTTSTKSLTELRGMLDTFYPDEPLAEDAGLARLDELVNQVRAGGLPVELEMENMDGTLTRDVDAVAYRVVQESLTNVLRHAGPTSAAVRITRRDNELLVRVQDDGRGSSSEVEPGRGLMGMRKRVEAAGGRLAAGPREGGGFLVTATLPISGATP